MDLNESIKIAVEGCGAKVYDIAQLKENDKYIFRVSITAPGGVNLEKCAEISRILSPLLDVNEPMHGKYFLEVSSPGIERKLKTLEHFEASIGDKAKIKDYNKDTIKGTISKVEGETVYLTTEHGEESISFDEISSANTYFEW
eukprot:Anaeramoba_flamelloidesc22753_g1_i1.p6 GENE.c22753_g1_i1~~c22753_g1_i1.p6  ORF type:complete len:143 (-),score=18.77 c22753_g1_i1:640-1068(-)